MSKYLFTSQRLGFRNWTDQDIPLLAEMNQDSEVMAFFPSTSNRNETEAFVKAMQEKLQIKGYCYFAVDLLSTGQFIGFIGISDKEFESDFTPCVDIGWRLDKKVWGIGLAREGAKRCLEFAFHSLQLEHIYAIAPAVNLRSERVMQGIGMNKVGTFNHPQLLAYPQLQPCILYQISAKNYV